MVRGLGILDGCTVAITGPGGKCNISQGCCALSCRLTANGSLAEPCDDLEICAPVSCDSYGVVKRAVRVRDLGSAFSLSFNRLAVEDRAREDGEA